MIQPTDRVLSVVFTPEGLSTAGRWVTVDSRLVRFSNASFLNGLGLRWQETPAPEGQKSARFAVLSAQQVVALHDKGKGSFEYLQVEDTAAFLLIKAGTTVPNFHPLLLARSRAGVLTDVEVQGIAPQDATALDLTITARELSANPRVSKVRSQQSKAWVGAAKVPIKAGTFALVDVSAAFGPATPKTRTMLLLAPGAFEWKDGRMSHALPWGKTRLTAIEGRTVAVKWPSSQLLPVINPN